MWWSLAAGVDENHTFGAAGPPVGDSAPPRDETLFQRPPVGSTDGAKRLQTGGIGQEVAEMWGILAGRGWLAIAALDRLWVTEPLRAAESPNASPRALIGTR